MVKHKLGHTCVFGNVYTFLSKLLLLSYLHNIPRKEKTTFLGAKRRITAVERLQ